MAPGAAHLPHGRALSGLTTGSRRGCGACRAQRGTGCPGGWKGVGVQAKPARLRSWAFFCRHSGAGAELEEGQCDRCVHGMLARAVD